MPENAIFLPKSFWTPNKINNFAPNYGHNISPAPKAE